MIYFKMFVIQAFILCVYVDNLLIMNNILNMVSMLNETESHNLI